MREKGIVRDGSKMRVHQCAPWVLNSENVYGVGESGTHAGVGNGTEFQILLLL